MYQKKVKKETENQFPNLELVDILHSSTYVECVLGLQDINDYDLYSFILFMVLVLGNLFNNITKTQEGNYFLPSLKWKTD